ncbi:hypothetical protein FE257_003491 [Aspergillus nanangensis]|uniref:Amino acid permease/ SLC12A domain-containing protein n=1 Tax=Aspergillus nanangensis TaxID=2582783 RepID=A0AAD4GPJ5_ASPNN|nr:hypothetical protein FE257_003491 [Aspergillus nanangensis]
MSIDIEAAGSGRLAERSPIEQDDTEKPTNYSIRGLETSAETSLHHALQARHISMIAIGGALGTGLLVGTGRALAESGPGSLLIAFLFMGCIIFMIMAAIGEIVAWLPLSAGFAGYASRYCHPALGFTLGWTYWFNYVIAAPNQLTAVALVIQFWVPRETVNPGVFIAIFIVIIFCINYFGGIRFFGEFEFWLSSFKVIVIVGVILLALVLAAGGGPNGDAPGFRYWKDPGAFAEVYTTGPLGKFLGFWSVMVNATFAYLGTELVGTTAAEARSPRRSIPKAIRLTFYRILLFYCLSVFLVGLVVPYNSEELAFAAGQANPGANASAFVVAAKLAGIKVLPHIINACICLFVFSASNSDLYIASRTLYGLASDRAAPAIFKRTDRRGVPYVALVACISFALLAFMNVSNDSRNVFQYFVNLCTVLGLLTWISILITHIRFVRGRALQNIPDSAMPYVAPQGARGSIIAVIVCAIVALTKNFGVFITQGKPFDYASFITGYIGIPVYFILFFGHMLVTKSKLVKLEDIDFFTGKEIVDRYEAEFLEEERAKVENASGWAKVYRRFVAWLF